MSLRWRRGGAVQQSGGGGEIFGPTLGAASVRSGAGPRTVSNPGGGISFNSSQSLQSAINANATSSTFVCSVTNPVWNSSVGTSTKRPTIIFPGAPGQTVINANGLPQSALVTGDGCTVKGGTWQNVGVGAAGMGGTGDDVTIEDVRITGCFETGFATGGLNTRMSHCQFDTNGVKGMGTGNSGLFQTDGLILEYCNIFGNNTRNTNAGNEGGALKVAQSGNSIARYNWVHDNNGFGLWYDTGNWDCLIEENVCENNNMSGLFWEANYGSVLQHNYVVNNGRNVNVGNTDPGFYNTVNVRISDNPADQVAPNGLVNPVDIHHNYIDHTGSFGGQTGRLIMLWDHTDSAVRHCGNVQVHHNDFWLRTTNPSGIMNWDEDVISPISTVWQLWNLNNVYSNNQYHVASLSVTYWNWGTGTQTTVPKTFTEWQGFHPTGETRQLI